MKDLLADLRLWREELAVDLAQSERVAEQRTDRQGEWADWDARQTRRYIARLDLLLSHHEEGGGDE